MHASIVIRTLNEGRHLGALLDGIAGQDAPGLTHDVVVVDSGSTDDTVAIARRADCTVLTIARQDFSFGRSLNLGCAAAKGDFLVFVSGHCLPEGRDWLARLVAPLAEGAAEYVYGRQIGGPGSRYSECRIFAKYYPETPTDLHDGFFCNNANAALLRSAWEARRFDEELTGLEDMELAKRLTEAGGRVRYVPEACVRHLHDESWGQIRRRFEREAIALRHIMPQVHLTRSDLAQYVLTSIWLDVLAAGQDRCLPTVLADIVLYRCCQYWGSYCGNRSHRLLSNAQKQAFFYPK